MTWFDYILLAWWALGSLLVIGQIGKPRKTLEPSTAVVVCIINGLFVAGLLISRGVLA